MAVGSKFIPYARQQIDDDDVAAVTDVLTGTYLTSGPAVTAFENKICEVTKAKYSVSCSSGTAALHLAMLALGLRPGDSVVVPSITFLATANAARYVGADVVFSDVDPDSGLMGPKQLIKTIQRTRASIKAVIAVHLGGQGTDIEQIGKIANENDLFVIEDASHAFGSQYTNLHGKFCVGDSSYSDITVFSFHPIKLIAMGEGGAVNTNSLELSKRVKLLRNHGMTKEEKDLSNCEMAFDPSGRINPWYYEMHELGLNYRVSDIHCALGLSQIKKLEKFIARRREIVGLYDELLSPLNSLVRPVERSSGWRPAWHLYQVLVNFSKLGFSRKALMEKLQDHRIGTQVHYIPLHSQPYYRGRGDELELPGAESFYNSCLSLPLFAGMADSDVKHVVGVLEDSVRTGLDR